MSNIGMGLMVTFGSGMGVAEVDWKIGFESLE